MRRLVVAGLVAGCLMAVPSSGVADPRSKIGWRALHVPFTSVGSGDRGQVAVRFRGTEVRYEDLPGDAVQSIAASADSAVLLIQDYERPEFRGPLYEISADGTTGRVEKLALGIPIADPTGHYVFWTSGQGEFDRLIAYDTRTHERILGPEVVEPIRVFAADGDTAYVAANIDDEPGAGTWVVGENQIEHLVLPSSDDDGTAWIGDASGGRVVSTDYRKVFLSDLEGNVLRKLPFRALGVFSPNDRYLFGAGIQGKSRVYDLDKDQFVEFRGTGQWVPTNGRWSPTGLLVVGAERRPLGGDDVNAVRRFACRLPSGRCQALPGVSKVFYEPLVPSSGLGQFLTLYGGE